MVSFKSTASVMSRSSSIRSTRLAELYSTEDMALHPFLEASWTSTSRQYHFPELILSRFCRILVPVPSMWTCDKSKHLGSDAIHQHFSVWGQQDSPTLSSSWLGSECLSSHCSEPWFKPIEGLFQCPLLASCFLLLSIGHCCIQDFLCFASTIHLLDFYESLLRA